MQKYNHTMNKIPLDEFEKTQMINLKNIACNICKEKNKYNTVFYLFVPLQKKIFYSFILPLKIIGNHLKIVNLIMPLKKNF